MRCGIISLRFPRGGIIDPISKGFANNGIDVETLYRTSEWNLQAYEFIVLFGPIESMTWAVNRIMGSNHCPPVGVWLTEQVLNPRIPKKFAGWLARIRYQIESYSIRNPDSTFVTKKPFSWLFEKQGRLRILGELLRLQENGLLRLLATFTETNSLFYRKFGMPSRVIPMGYDPEFGEYLGLKKDIDVVFLGSTRDKRRASIVSWLDIEYSKRGINFIIKDGSPERGYVFGDERTKLINKSKIMLNIMRQPWDDPVFRLLLTAPCKTMLLSENIYKNSRGPFLPKVHFDMAELSHLITTTEYYLEDDMERERISSNAYKFVTSDLTMAKMAKKFLEEMKL